MKIWLTGLLICVISAGCKPETTGVGKILQGEHALRKLASSTESTYHASGGMFFLIGSYSANGKTETVVKFAWLMNDGKTWAISSLPLERIRVRLTDKEIAPTIKFAWLRGPIFKRTLQDLMDREVTYAVITCNGKNWPINVQMPLNKPSHQTGF